jgi:hypothetical protein
MNMDINMKNFAIIKNGIVENVIVWDGVCELQIEGTLIEVPESIGVSIGFLYQDGQFIDPNPPIIEEPIVEPTTQE